MRLYSQLPGAIDHPIPTDTIPPAPLPNFRRFSRQTTIAELTDWWLDSVARHQVRTSTLDSYRKFAGYLADDIGTHRVVDVGPETLTQWQSKLLDKYAPYTVLNCRKSAARPSPKR